MNEPLLGVENHSLLVPQQLDHLLFQFLISKGNEIHAAEICKSLNRPLVSSKSVQ